MVKLLPDSIAVTQTHIGLRDGNEDGDAQGAGLWCVWCVCVCHVWWVQLGRHRRW